jgi:hypothetical protein
VVQSPDLGYVPENPCPYGIFAPRRRSQPIRIHRSSSSRSTGPASINSPAAMSSSPRRAASEPGTGDDPGAFCSDVVAALRYITKMIN